MSRYGIHLSIFPALTYALPILAHEDRGMMQLIRILRGDLAIPSHVEITTVRYH